MPLCAGDGGGQAVVKRREIQSAAEEGRLALCPAWLLPGREVWYWRECLCLDDPCMDMAANVCPLNAGAKWYEESARDCAQRHPVLEHTTVWSVGAYFTPRGVEWLINELPGVADGRLRDAFFETEEAARAARPRKMEAG